MAQGDPDLSVSILTPAPNPVTANTNFFALARGNDTLFHFGILNPPPPGDTSAALSQNLGPFVFDGVSMPCQWWWSWYRKRANPIRIIKSPRQLVDARRMFAYAPSPLIPAQPPRVPVTGPMQTSDDVIYEDETGERAQIGLITDQSAYYMLGGDPGSMIDYGLVGDTCPVHMRDQSTGLPIDLTKYPQANAYDTPGAGSPWIAKGPPATNSGGYSAYGGNWTPQQAHHPEYCYMAHIATGDPGFLESLQYHANFMVIAGTPKASTTQPIIVGEYRGIAWALRTVFMAHIATKDAEAAGPLPDWLMPSSYFKAILDDNLAYYSAALTDPARQTFHTLLPGVFAPWQCDYLLQALAFGVLTGHSDWAPLYLWAMNNAIDRLSGASGYPPAWAGYYLDGTQSSWAAAFAALQTNAYGGTPPTPAEVAALTEDPFNGGVPLGTPEYLQATQAVIAAAQYLDDLGLAAVRATFPNLDACYEAVNKMIQNGAGMEARHAISSDPTVAPTTIRQPQGTTMNLITGSTHVISVVNLKDASGNPVTLPPGMLPAYTPSDPTLVTMGTQNQDGSQSFVVGNTASPGLTFTGKLVYPDGNPVALTPITVTISTDEAVTGDLSIT